MTQMRVAKHGWIDGQGRVLALFGNTDAANFLFDLLTDDQARKFLEYMQAGNTFLQPHYCAECQTELFTGNSICPNCGHDAESEGTVKKMQHSA